MYFFSIFSNGSSVKALTEAETLQKLSEKADKADVYLKTETYSQTEVDELLDDKAKVGDSYTKAEADAMIQEIRQNEAIFLNRNTVGDGIIKEGWNGLSVRMDPEIPGSG